MPRRTTLVVDDALLGGEHSRRWARAGSRPPSTRAAGGGGPAIASRTARRPARRWRRDRALGRVARRDPSGPMTLRCVDTSAWHHADQTGPWRRNGVLRSRPMSSDCATRFVGDPLLGTVGARLRPAGPRMVALHHISMDESTFERARDVQQRLAHAGGLHHRSVKIADSSSPRQRSCRRDRVALRRRLRPHRADHPSTEPSGWRRGSL